MKLKIKTNNGHIFTIVVIEQTLDYISGTDKFGAYVKLKLSDIESSTPISENCKHDK